MSLKYPYELRDPIYGLIRLTEQEIAIVNTTVFQRLRRIRQLAMADLVYPGALHTRFEHSLGTLHIAHRIPTQLDGLERLFDNDIGALSRCVDHPAVTATYRLVVAADLSDGCADLPRG